MKLKLLIVTALLATALAVPAPAGASPSAYSPYLVSTQILGKATNVAICEEGGWSASSDQNGPRYFGNLGWLWVTWQQFRAPNFPVSMHDATPRQQAWAMAHFVGSVFHGWWPDQGHCTGPY